MKTDIHPTYYTETKITCACGAKYEAGSTTKEIKIEVCSACHPFYTGKQDQLIDTTGRVDKFKAKMEKAKAYQEKHAPKEVKKVEVVKKNKEEEEVVEQPKKQPILEMAAEAEEVAATEEMEPEEVKKDKAENVTEEAEGTEAAGVEVTEEDNEKAEIEEVKPEEEKA